MLARMTTGHLHSGWISFNSWYSGRAALPWRTAKLFWRNQCMSCISACPACHSPGFPSLYLERGRVYPSILLLSSPYRLYSFRDIVGHRGWFCDNDLCPDPLSEHIGNKPLPLNRIANVFPLSVTSQDSSTRSFLSNRTTHRLPLSLSSLSSAALV